MKNKNKGFTLIEVVIGVTIFSMIMISVMAIYILASDTSLKSDINRAMHENTKNIFTDISENVINNGIDGVSESYIDSCDFNTGSNNYKVGTKLCISGDEYYIAKFNGTSYIRVSNADCGNIADHCYVVKNGVPITNSLVSIKKMNFIVTDTFSKKVTLSMVLMPTTKSGVKSTQIEENTLNFQTTINYRPF